jgi:predicted membrane protein
MGKLFRGIKNIVLILEVIGALLSAIIFIFNKIGVMKKIHKTQNPQTPAEKK